MTTGLQRVRPRVSRLPQALRTPPSQGPDSEWTVSRFYTQTRDSRRLHKFGPPIGLPPRNTFTWTEDPRLVLLPGCSLGSTHSLPDNGPVLPRNRPGLRSVVVRSTCLRLTVLRNSLLLLRFPTRVLMYTLLFGGSPFVESLFYCPKYSLYKTTPRNLSGCPHESSPDPWSCCTLVAPGGPRQMSHRYPGPVGPLPPSIPLFLPPCTACPSTPCVTSRNLTYVL